MCLRDRPVREHSATAAPGDSHAGRIYVPALEYLVDARHQILVIVARVVELDDVGEVLSVRSAAARVGVEHDVALGRHPEELLRERAAVSSVRSAMDLENERIFL